MTPNARACGSAAGATAAVWYGEGNAAVRQEVRQLIVAGKYAEARIRALDLSGLANREALIKQIAKAEKGAGPQPGHHPGSTEGIVAQRDESS